MAVKDRKLAFFAENDVFSINLANYINTLFGDFTP
jgi:hypothetical protein